MRSPPRLSWAPDDAALVSYRARTVQLHDASGAAVRELATERIYDVRFCDDAQIVVLDDRGSLTFSRDGALVAQTHFKIPAPLAASMSASGDRYVALTDREIFAVQLVGERTERIWTLHARSYGVETRELRAQLAVEISPDGRLVAIGFTQTIERQLGRGFLAIELATDTYLQRAWQRGELRGGTQQFAFDAAGARLAHALGDPLPTWGVTRLDADAEPRARPLPGGARAVALDRGGILAAYAYAAAPVGAVGRVRVDYLSPVATGSATVEVMDSLSIDPALPDIVAIAFSRDSRQLACLASTGAIEVVPVP